METQANESIMSLLSEMGHEQVVFCNDKETGLQAIIGVHNTVLGPALGGTRMWQYASDYDALIDVLRLSRGMTYKAAVAGLNLGGGKAVIIGDAKTQKTEPYLRRFGKFVESLGGRYITAEDVNMKTRDMEYIAMESTHVTGLPSHSGGSGDPSPVTAFGTYVGIKAMAKKAYGSESLEGKKIWVQGVGQVGMFLTEQLRKENAKVFISDIDQEKLKTVATNTGAEVLTEEGYGMDFDIYAPCALGATLNDETIPQLKVDIVAGAANNQLKRELIHGKALVNKGILYAPDFVINAGGLINVYLEHRKEYNRERAYGMAEKIYDNCMAVVNMAEEKLITPQEAAIEVGNARIEAVGKVKLSY